MSKFRFQSTVHPHWSHDLVRTVFVWVKLARWREQSNKWGITIKLSYQCSNLSTYAVWPITRENCANILTKVVTLCSNYLRSVEVSPVQHYSVLVVVFVFVRDVESGHDFLRGCVRRVESRIHFFMDSTNSFKHHGPAYQFKIKTNI